MRPESNAVRGAAYGIAAVVSYGGRKLSARVLIAAIAIAAAATASAADVPSLRQLLERIDTLAANKEWSAAEATAQEAVRRFPQSRDAQLRLAQTVLWRGHYDRAHPMLARLVERNPADVEARLGMAQAAYWSGDYRQALRDFETILRLRPDDAEATRAIREIQSAARPGYTIGAAGISDDQPYRSARTAATVWYFSDPLTKWEAGVAGARLRAGSLSRTGREVFGSGETVLPRARVRLHGEARWLRFPDGRGQLLPSFSAARSGVALTLERRELLRTAAALRSHPFAGVVAIRYGHVDDDREPRFAVSAESLRYFDGNRGAGADAYVLAPLGRCSFGASAAWKDTRDSRFRADTGGYDPYWTPQDLRAKCARWPRRRCGFAAPRSISISTAASRAIACSASTARSTPGAPRSLPACR